MTIKHFLLFFTTVFLILGSTLSLAMIPGARPAEMKNCVGAAMTDNINCAAGDRARCTSTSKTGHQANAWNLVPKGSCGQIISTTTSTGLGQMAAYKSKF